MATKLTLDIEDYATSLKSAVFDKTVLTDRVARKFYHYNDSSLSLLPPVIRYITPNFGGFIMERPPETRVIVYKNAMKYGKAESQMLKIKVPWAVYGIVLRPTLNANGEVTGQSPVLASVFYRPQQIWSEESELYQPCLPNTQSGNICLGDTANRLAELPNPVDAMCALIEGFWSGVFNNNMGSTFHKSVLPTNFAKQFKENHVHNEDIVKAMQEVKMEDLLKDEFKVSEYYRTTGDLMQAIDRSASAQPYGQAKKQGAGVDYYFAELMS